MLALNRFPLAQLLLCALVLLALGATATGCQRAQAQEQAQALPAAFSGVALTDQDGKALGAKELGGSTLVVSFMFTSCPSVCPKQTRALGEVQRNLPSGVRGRARFLSLSVDPEHDTPAEMRRFALASGADLRGWSFANAGQQGTQTLTSRLAAFDSNAGSSPAAHTTAIYLFDARGRLLQRYAGAVDVPRLTREVTRVDELSRGGNTD